MQLPDLSHSSGPSGRSQWKAILLLSPWSARYWFQPFLPGEAVTSNNTSPSLVGLKLASVYVPAAGPLACPKYPGGGMGGMTRLKGIGMFIAGTWLGPALIIPIWSWVWKYMLDGRPREGNSAGELWDHAGSAHLRSLPARECLGTCRGDETTAPFQGPTN